MCRMLAVVGGPASQARELLLRFRIEASAGKVGRGMAPGHADGWGIAFADGGALRYAGRAPTDAAHDADYPAAVARVAAVPALVHLRKATLGAKTLENTHPFLDGGYAFAHNGTVRGLPEGGNDSRALFARLLAEIRKGATVEDAIATVARDVDARHAYTSLTFLLADGRGVWGFRRIGNDPVACAPEACPQDYYTLGHAPLPAGGTVVSQEHEILGIAGWRGIGDGEMLHVDPAGRVTTRRVLPARF